MRASMAFLVQQILDEPNVPRNLALGLEGLARFGSTFKNYI